MALQNTADHYLSILSAHGMERSAHSMNFRSFARQPPPFAASSLPSSNPDQAPKEKKFVSLYYKTCTSQDEVVRLLRIESQDGNFRLLKLYKILENWKSFVSNYTNSVWINGIQRCSFHFIENTVYLFQSFAPISYKFTERGLAED